MFEFMKKEKNIIFAAGAVFGMFAIKMAQTKKARELAVKGIAKGIQIKDGFMEEVENIKEEALDICEEAKKVAKNDCADNCEK